MARNLTSHWKMKWIPALRRTRKNKRAKRRQWKVEHRDNQGARRREEREPVGKGVGEGRSRPARRKPQ